jgi:SAM-dependent methyltransferase
MRVVGYGDRATRLLGGIPRNGRLIEVGASYNPLAPKAAGWQTTVVDHDVAEGLRRKYANAAVDPSRIEEVDVIWRSGALHQALDPATHGTFDALIISHVLEHLPDPVAFLSSADRLLKPDGVIAVAVPDKRYCFDAYRWPSTAGAMLQAHLEGRTRHTPATVFDEVSLSVTRDGRTMWPHGYGGGPPALFHPFDRARALFDAARDSTGDYIDCHAWQFTPASFELVFHDLALAGACPWFVSWVEPRADGEMLAQLRRGDPKTDTSESVSLRRAELLRALMQEVAAGAVDLA